MSGSVYPRWEREDRVSRFFRWSFLADLPNSGNPTDRRINVRRVRIGQGEFSGQFESEKNAKEACKRDFADKGKDPRDGNGPRGLNPRQKRG
jgi:hypothetical protein